MKKEIVFDENKHFLGKLCNKNHDYNNTGKSIRHMQSHSCILCGRERYYEKREFILEYQCNWNENNKDKVKKYKAKKLKEIQKHRKENPIKPKYETEEEKRLGRLYYQKKYYHNVKKHDLKYMIGKRISNLMNKSLKRGKGGKHWLNLVNYTYDELKNRLEKTLPENAIWQDYLDGKLQIDHIIPRAVFNYKDYSDIDFKRCWALDNLQLMWTKENQKKGKKLKKDFQPNLCIPINSADIYINNNKRKFISIEGNSGKRVKLNYKMEIKMNLVNLTDEQIESIVESTMLGVDEELENLDETKLTKEQIEAILRSALKNPMA